MKTLRTTLLILLLSLGLGLVACDDVSTSTPPETSNPSDPDPSNPEPSDPSQPSDPDPSPKSKDGLEQLIASADSTGKVSATVSFEVDESVVLGFMSKDKALVKFVQASFNLMTSEGKSFKALGIVTLGEDSTFKEGDTSFSAKGDFSFEGQVESVNGLKVIRANSSLVFGKDNQELSVALLMLRTSNNLAEPRVEAFKGTSTLSISGTDLGSSRILAPTQLANKTWGSIAFTGKNDAGDDFVGFGVADLSNAQTPDSEAEFSFSAKNITTPYGNAHQLVGKLQSPKEAVLLFDEADAFALTIGLKTATKPSEPDPKSTDGFAELTQGLKDGDSVNASLSYKLSPLKSSLRDIRVETVPAEYIFTTESGKTFKALALISLPAKLAGLSDEDIFAAITNERVDLTSELTELKDFSVLVGTTELNLKVGTLSFNTQATLLAFPNSLKLNTQENHFLKSSSASLKLGENGIFSFVAEDSETSFAGIGISDPEDAKALKEKESLEFLTELLETSSGNAGEVRGFIPLEDKSVLPIIAITIGLETQEETRTVTFCADCKEDVVSVLSKEQLAVVNWPEVAKLASGVPNWVKGAEPVPYGDKPTCDAMYQLFFDSALGANFYRTFYIALHDNADLLRFEDGIATTYVAGTKEHTATQTYLLAAKDQSFLTVGAVIDTMSTSGCFAKPATLTTLAHEVGLTETVVVEEEDPNNDRSGWAFWFPDFTFEKLPPLLANPPIKYPSWPPPYESGDSDDECLEAARQLADRSRMLVTLANTLVIQLIDEDGELGTVSNFGQVANAINQVRQSMRTLQTFLDANCTE